MARIADTDQPMNTEVEVLDLKTKELTQLGSNAPLVHWLEGHGIPVQEVNSQIIPKPGYSISIVPTGDGMLKISWCLTPPIPLEEYSEIKHLRFIASILWQLLDNIDSLSDAIKPVDGDEYKEFYKRTMEAVSNRFDSMISDGYKLYIPNPHAPKQPPKDAEPPEPFEA